MKNCPVERYQRRGHQVFLANKAELPGHAALRIDHISLQRQGFNTEGLGIAAPEKLPVYLFSRAKAFGHGKAYAITWSVLAVLEIVWLL